MFADTLEARQVTLPRVLGPSAFGDRSPLMRRRDGRRYDAGARSGQYVTAMTFHDGAEEAEQLYWDEVADVVCAGPGAGGLVAAIAAADAGLKVVAVESERQHAAGATSLPDRLGVLDSDTTDYLDALTQDLRPLSGLGWNAEIPIQAMGGGPGMGRGGQVGAFVGARLKDWAAGCLESPYGVLYSRVFDRNMVTEYAQAGEPIEVAVVGSIEFDPDQPATALTEWLISRAHDCKIEMRAASSLQRLVFDAGQVVGAVIDGPGGPRSIRARRGVIMATGADSAHTVLPHRKQLLGATVEVAVVSRPASRFARVELLTR